jgi:hypothetical protein
MSSNNLVPSTKRIKQMIIHRVRVQFLISFVIFSFFSSYSLAAEPVRIVSGGPATIAILAPHKAQLEKLAKVPVEISVNPSDIAMKALVEGVIDAVIAPPIDEAIAGAKKRGIDAGKESDYDLFPLFDNVVRIGVNPENPVKELTHQQIADILSGKVTDWEPITGKKMPIKTFIAKNYMTSARALTQFYIKSDTSPIANYVLDKDGLLRALQRDPGAIGFFTTKEKLGNFEPRFMQTEVARTSYFVIRKNARPEARRVFDYLKAQPKAHVN